MALGLTLSGYYLAWLRELEPVPNLRSAIGSSLNGALIVAFLVAAVWTARARRFEAHGRWAIRLYLEFLECWPEGAGVRGSP